MREVSAAEETTPEEPAERRREPRARTLARVVPVAQRRSVGDITVALASLGFYGEGIGVLRWRVHSGTPRCEGTRISRPGYSGRGAGGAVCPGGRRGARGPGSLVRDIRAGVRGARRRGPRPAVVASERRRAAGGVVGRRGGG